MSLHADVAVPTRDRKRLERLCRYILRPAVTLERLEELPDGMLSYRLKNRWRDGTTHILMERRELLERLAPLIPPPRAHQVRYHGILAPCAAGRSRVVPGAAAAAPMVEQVDLGRKTSVGASSPKTPSNLDAQVSTQTARFTPVARAASVGNPPTPTAPHTGKAAFGAYCGDRSPVASKASMRASPALRSATVVRPRRLSWSELLKRVFGVDALRCRDCGASMRIMAAITNPEVARRILECLKLPSRAPPLGEVQRAARSVPDPYEGAGASEFEVPPSAFDFDQRPNGGGGDDDGLF